MKLFIKKTIFLVVSSFLILELSAKESTVSSIYDRIVALVGLGSVESTEQITDLLEELGKIKTVEASKALVTLLDYYIGEYPHEKLLELITKRGVLMVPVLKQKIVEPMKCKPKRNGKILECSDIGTRNAFIRECLLAIDRGVILWSEYPDDIYKVAEWDIKKIKLALADYYDQHKVFPSDLNKVQAYIQDRFNDRLRIYDPWGKIYDYTLDQKGGYSISSKELSNRLQNK